MEPIPLKLLVGAGRTDVKISLADLEIAHRCRSIDIHGSVNEVFTAKLEMFAGPDLNVSIPAEVTINFIIPEGYRLIEEEINEKKHFRVERTRNPGDGCTCGYIAELHK